MAELIPLFMFVAVCLVLMLGYPVAFSLAGTALVFALIGSISGHFDASYLNFTHGRLYGIITNGTLIAVPLFVFMGVMLEKSKIAEDLLQSMALVFGRLPGGLGISVIIVGMLLAASTGIVGATVVTMGLMSLPTMLKRNYNVALATGTISATGTLGQIIPPSIALVLLGDVLSSAYQQAQYNMGGFGQKSISVADLFAGAIIPGLILVGLYILYVFSLAVLKPQLAPRLSIADLQKEMAHDDVLSFVLKGLIPAVILIVAVLGSILCGLATPTEAAGVGALGAMLLSISKHRFNIVILKQVMRSTTKVTSMVFLILIGANIFSLVFRGFGGDEAVQQLFANMGDGAFVPMLIVMVVIFFLGFILDFIEITFVVVPIVGPVLLSLGIHPVWLGIMIAVNLQTSFLTPPFGFALFYLRGVAPESIKTIEIYRGVVPYIIIQILLLLILSVWPELAYWLPDKIYGE